MISNHIFIAFSKKETVANITRILEVSGFNIATATTSASTLLENISYYGGGTIVCGCKFRDMFILDLFEHIPDSFNVIAIGSHDQLALINSTSVFKLSVPLQANDLVCSVSMFANMENGGKSKATNRTNDETRIIERAKKVLMDRFDMNEDEAHSYMQKKSMNTGKKMVDIARNIVEK